MLLLIAWLGLSPTPEMAAHTPLVVEGGYAAPGSWVALIRGQPWVCWHDPSVAVQTIESCWHPLALLRSARAPRLCGKSEFDDVDLGLGVIASDEIEADTALCNESADESFATSEDRWAFAFADSQSLWIRTPRGETYLGTPTGQSPARTLIQAADAPALLALQQPRRLRCASQGWLPQQRAGTWSWRALACDVLQPAKGPLRPALQEKRQLPLRIRLHVEAIRGFSGSQWHIVDRHRLGQWSFFLGFRLDYRPPFERPTHRRLPDPS